MAVVVPPPGGLKDTARLLLTLAGDPADVRTVQAGNAFEVPDTLADAYNDHLTGKSGTAKRRGRTPRATEKE